LENSELALILVKIRAFCYHKSMQSTKPLLKGIIFTGLFLVPFVPFLMSGHFFFPYITLKAFTFRIIVEIIFASWLLYMLVEPEARPRRSLLLYALGAFLLVIALANVFGLAPVKSFWSNFERMEGYVTLLHLGAYFVVAGSVMRELHWSRWWNTSLVASALMSLYALGQVFNAEIWRVDATFGNATYMAVYVLFHIFIAGLMLARAKKGSFMMWVYGALILLHTYVLYHTATRGAMLGLVGGALVLATINLFNKDDGRARKFAIGGVLAVIVLIGGFLALRNTAIVQENPVLVRFAQISTEEIRGGGRSFVWPMAFEGFKDKPILGWGQENFNYIFNERYDPEMYRLEPWFDRAHNIFLDWAVAGGALGLGAYLSLYVLLVYLLWKPGGGEDENFSFIERSVLTALVTAYFIHNLFVFDHLISYVLFFSLLGYVHSRNTGAMLGGEKVAEQRVANIAMPVVLVLLVSVIYFVNVRPIVANTSLIQALRIFQMNQSELPQATDYLRRAHESSRLGRPEVVEQTIINTPRIMQSAISDADKSAFLAYAVPAVVRQTEEASGDARYELMAGSFFSAIGRAEEALPYLERARELSPGKQSIYFELGAVHIRMNNPRLALEEFGRALELAPENVDARVMLLLGAIFADDGELIARLAAEIPPERLVGDERVLSALVEMERYDTVREILEVRLSADPQNPQNYLSLAGLYVHTNQRSRAIEVLESLKRNLPEHATSSDELIRQIRAGEL
jgi:O-antigen ligase/tetratricopeptide (TPR) repeat protein